MSALLDIRLRLHAAAISLVLAAAVGLAAPAARADDSHAGAQPVDQVVQWNRVLLDILRTPGAQPATVHPTRSLAIMHAAIYDAVDAIEHTSAPYLVSLRAPRRASPEAAAAAAAHEALVKLYPGEQAMLDAQLATSLAQIPNGYHKDEGIHVGEAAADGVLALRADDGSNAVPTPFTPRMELGDYRPTPPKFGQPVFTHWAHVHPFAIQSASQFRPMPPSPLTSSAYKAAFAEVRSLGSVTSTTRTPQQTQIAEFWAPPIWITWNEIAETAAIAHHDTLAEDARLFALLDLSFADATIAFYDAKYAYHLWRPVTAIEATADPSWTPLTPTAPDPSYPGAHSTISSAGATVLSTFFGGERFRFAVRSDALPGVTRTFASFGAAAEEAGLSRIYAGQHFRTDHVAGLGLGHDVASYVLETALEPGWPSNRL
jgi:membrane-associated phospholipid phosphatase